MHIYSTTYCSGWRGGRWRPTSGMWIVIGWRRAGTSDPAALRVSPNRDQVLGGRSSSSSWTRGSAQATRPLLSDVDYLRGTPTPPHSASARNPPTSRAWHRTLNSTGLPSSILILILILIVWVVSLLSFERVERCACLLLPRVLKRCFPFVSTRKKRSTVGLYFLLARASGLRPTSRCPRYRRNPLSQSSFFRPPSASCRR